jgi:N4-gp56 family major capsid protein
MATTSYGVNSNEAVKLWSRKLMREALKETWSNRFMGTTSDSLCQILDDTQKGPGDRIRCILRMQLTGDGIQGDGTLEGNEEALVTYTDDVVINQLRHAVRSQGKMTEQRIPFSVREEAMMGLRDWWADRYDTWFMNQISGNSAETDTKKTGNNAAIAPVSTHVLYANGHTTEAALTATASALFSLKMVDQAVLKARTLAPIIRPLRTGMAGAKYVMFITPEMVHDLRRDTNTLQWADIQRAAMEGGKVSGNGLFTGALGMYNGVILHEAYRLPTFTSTGGSTTGRAVLCGAQSAVMGFGRGYGKSRMDWAEELFDYGNSLGVGAGCIGGIKKTVYNSADFATITLMAAHSTDATTASGR